MKNNEKVFAIINVSLLLAIIAIVGVILITVERPTVSETEQRKLSEKPSFTWGSFFSGEYTSKLSAYYNDTVPLRDDFKKVAANLRGLSGVSFQNAQIYGSLKEITPPETTVEPAVTAAPLSSTDELVAEPSETTAMTTDKAVESTTEPPLILPQNEEAQGFYDNNLLTVFQNGHWQGLSMFGGGSGNNYAKYVNNFKAKLGDDVKMYSMIAPTACEYYTPSNYAKYNASQRDSIDSINSQLVDVLPVDAWGKLLGHVNEPIYTRTDHHWQPLGAYYAAEAFATAAEVPFADISEYVAVEIPGYVGTMYTYTEAPELLNDPETFTYYKPQNEYTVSYYTTDFVFQYNAPLFVKQPVTQSYSTFMGGDAKIVEIETDAKNDRVLAVFKDSYGNAEIPFLLNSFSKIYVCDIRYFEPNAVDFVTENGITDILFTMCTFSAVGGNAEHIGKMGA